MMMENQRIEQIAEAIKQRFKDRVSDHAQMPFDETGVTLPSDEVWRDYASAAAGVIPELDPYYGSED